MSTKAKVYCHFTSSHTNTLMSNGFSRFNRCVRVATLRALVFTFLQFARAIYGCSESILIGHKKKNSFYETELQLSVLWDEFKLDALDMWNWPSAPSIGICAKSQLLYELDCLFFCLFFHFVCVRVIQSQKSFFRKSSANTMHWMYWR